MSMTIDPSTVLRYLKIAEDANVGEDARLSVANGLQGRTIRAVATGYASRLGERVFRNDSDRESYREVRRDFLDCLKALYGVEKDSDLPPMVLAAFQKGEGVTGRPLTKRRISFVLDAVRRDLGYASMNVFCKAADEAAKAKADESKSADDSDADEEFDGLPKGYKVGVAPSNREDDEATKMYKQFRVNISGVVRGQEADDLENSFYAFQKFFNSVHARLQGDKGEYLGLGVKKWLDDVYRSLTVNTKKDHIDSFNQKPEIIVLGKAERRYIEGNKKEVGRLEKVAETKEEMGKADGLEEFAESFFERFDEEIEAEKSMSDAEPESISEDFKELREQSGLLELPEDQEDARRVPTTLTLGNRVQPETSAPPSVTKPPYTFKQALEILKRLTTNTVDGNNVDLMGRDPGQNAFDNEEVVRSLDKSVLLSVENGELTKLVKRDDETIKRRIRCYLDNHEKDIPELLRENVEETVSKMMDRLDVSKDYFSHERCVLLDDSDDIKESRESVCSKLLDEVEGVLMSAETKKTRGWRTLED